MADISTPDRRHRLAQIGYEAFAARYERVYHSALCHWDKLHPQSQEAWAAGVDAIALELQRETNNV